MYPKICESNLGDTQVKDPEAKLSSYQLRDIMQHDTIIGPCLKDILGKVRITWERNKRHHSRIVGDVPFPKVSVLSKPLLN